MGQRLLLRQKASPPCATSQTFLMTTGATPSRLGVRPLGAGLQGQARYHPMLLRLGVVVVSVEVCLPRNGWGQSGHGPSGECWDDGQQRIGADPSKSCPEAVGTGAGTRINSTTAIGRRKEMSPAKPRLIPKCNGGVCPLGLLAVGCSASCLCSAWRRWWSSSCWSPSWS